MSTDKKIQVFLDQPNPTFDYEEEYGVLPKIVLLFGSLRGLIPDVLFELLFSYMVTPFDGTYLVHCEYTLGYGKSDQDLYSNIDPTLLGSLPIESFRRFIPLPRMSNLFEEWILAVLKGRKYQRELYQEASRELFGVRESLTVEVGKAEKALNTASVRLTTEQHRDAPRQEMLNIYERRFAKAERNVSGVHADLEMVLAEIAEVTKVAKAEKVTSARLKVMVD